MRKRTKPKKKLPNGSFWSEEIVITISQVTKESSTFEKGNSGRSHSADPWIRKVIFLDKISQSQGRIAINDGNIQMFGQWHAGCMKQKKQYSNLVIIDKIGLNMHSIQNINISTAKSTNQSRSSCSNFQ